MRLHGRRASRLHRRLWVVGQLVGSPNGSFAEIFGTCELLPLGALLLLSVSADIRSEEDAKAGVWLAVHEVLFLVVAIGAITVYGSLRARSLDLLRDQSEEGRRTLSTLAALSWLYVGYAVSHTLPVKAMLVKAHHQRSQQHGH